MPQLRAVPCATAGCQGPLLPDGGRMPGVAAFPERVVRPAVNAGPSPGRPYLMGRAPSRFPWAAYCAACHRTTRLTAPDWNRLPELSIAELERMGELGSLIRDLRGDGLDERQARDMFARGWSPISLYEAFGARGPLGEIVGPPVDRAHAEALAMLEAAAGPVEGRPS